MTHASLFSGGGGFDLAAEICGIENIFQVEIDDYCQSMLKKNFPNVPKFSDIKQFNGVSYHGTIDIISGGLPCQPFSVAGKRKGTTDDRFLWAEMYRIIQEIRPRWVIIENVQGLLTSEHGMVFESCLTDLESQGYETETFIIPAQAVNAPHLRNRVWIIANSGSRNGRSLCRQTANTGIKQKKINERGNVGNFDITENTSNSNGKRKLQSSRFISKKRKRISNRDSEKSRWDGNWIDTASKLCRVDDGLSNRLERIKMLGNGIVPQVAIQIFLAILFAEKSFFKQNQKDLSWQRRN